MWPAPLNEFDTPALEREKDDLCLSVLATVYICVSSFRRLINLLLEIVKANPGL